MFNMKELFVGSGNINKIKEIDTILKDNGFNIDLKCPKDFCLSEEPLEDGFSFKDNAIIKAEYYYQKLKMPVLSEDSGIMIEYFNNLPGIHSKRFLNGLSNSETNEQVLDLMRNVKNRNAKFQTVICFIDDNGRIYLFEGINEGEISYKQLGSEGFGYDPIFYIPSEDKTEAELGLEYKNKNSHRAKALKKFIEYLKENEK